jgi:predicted DNA-binding transcriptional regulator AlpA
MARLSTREAAKKLGISYGALAKYVVMGKVPRPETVQQGERTIHIWTESEIEHVRQLLPKIANGRKTRYKKQSAKTKAQPTSAVPRKKQSSKKPKPASG